MNLDLLEKLVGKSLIVRINGEMIEVKQLSCRTPQGTVLGSIVFTKSFRFGENEEYAGQ